MMDSGNSGSLQSSSGGEDEYDSRADSFSAFFNPTGQAPPPAAAHHNSSMFDPLSSYFPSPPLASCTNQLPNLDPMWSKALRSDPNCTGISHVFTSPAPLQPFYGSISDKFGPLVAGTENTVIGAGPLASSPSAATTGQAHPVRNPRKRSRASRRAPTTVLTTDTNNFRAMVQEFTGIPAPPFGSSSPFGRTRLDLFGAPSVMRSHPLVDATSQPPYLLRPFAQKFQPPPPLPPFVVPPPSSSAASPASSLSSSPFLSSTSVTTSAPLITNVSSTNSIDYQFPPVLTFQSLLQSAPKYPLSDIPANLGSKMSFEISTKDPHLRPGAFDELGSSHGLPSPASWVDGTGTADRPVNGRYDYPGSLSNGKFNFSTDFCGVEKGPDNAAAAGGGVMVDSWDLAMLNSTNTNNHQAKQNEKNDGGGGGYDNT